MRSSWRWSKFNELSKNYSSTNAVRWFWSGTSDDFFYPKICFVAHYPRCGSLPELRQRYAECISWIFAFKREKVSMTQVLFTTHHSLVNITSFVGLGIIFASEWLIVSWLSSLSPWVKIRFAPSAFSKIWVLNSDLVALHPRSEPVSRGTETIKRTSTVQKLCIGSASASCSQESLSFWPTVGWMRRKHSIDYRFQRWLKFMLLATDQKSGKWVREGFRNVNSLVRISSLSDVVFSSGNARAATKFGDHLPRKCPSRRPKVTKFSSLAVLRQGYLSWIKYLSNRWMIVSSQNHPRLTRWMSLWLNPNVSPR